jgi:hypothetical protein
MTAEPERPMARGVAPHTHDDRDAEEEDCADEAEAGTTTDADLAAVATTRRLLWNEGGYRPVPLLSHTDPDPKKAGKAPLHKDWTDRARKNPPEAATIPAQRHLANTGILADGLRLIDGDIDDSGVANAVEELCIEHLGAAPTRRRSNSNRFAKLYRAAVGEPSKRSIAAASHTTEHACKIEVLGRGQQFVAYGTHATGGTIYWSGPEPLDLPADKLPVVTEDQITAFLEAIAPVIGAPSPGPRRHKSNGASTGTAGAPLTALAAALDLIPADVADDREQWIRIGAALYHAAAGSDAGMELWATWAAKSGKFDPGETAEKWNSFADYPGDPAGAGTIFAIATPYGWHPPDPLDDPGYVAALVAAAAETGRAPRTINILALVTHINATPAWNGALRFNLLTENYEICPPFPPQDGAKSPPRPLNDPHDILLATMYFQANGFAKAGKGVVWDAITAVAHEHSYHPVRDYLNALQWDDVGRVGLLFRQYFNAELSDDPVARDRQIAYLEHISTSWMIGAVARIMEPGCKHDHVPVVVGRQQGMLKSTAIRTLCPDPAWFTDNISPDLIDRDTKESLRGKWIIELAELPHIRRETERVKVFFSAQADRYRAAYGRATQDHPRQNAFFGSSNDLEFVDVTGNRRFWPFLSAGTINIASIEADRDQLWAEALALYRQGVRWWLPPKIEAIAAEQQAAFVEDDVWEEPIVSWLGAHPDPFTLADLFAKDTGITPYRETTAVSKRDEMRAARCLIKLKLFKRQATIDRRRATFWLRK